MLTRRTLLLGTLAGCAGLSATGRALGPVLAQDNEPVTTLRLHSRSIEVNGRAASVLGIGQPDGTSGLFTEAGRRFRVRVQNDLAEPSLIHWHGLTPPWQQDGVPDISAPAIAPGGSADYDFPLQAGGTYWMHSHQGLQEQLLLTAPLIIRGPDDGADAQEVVVMLADFSFTPPEQILEDLVKMPMAAMPDMAGMTHGTDGSAMSAMPGMSHGGGSPTDAMPGMTHGAAAVPDLNDVQYDAFLANHRTLADPETVKVEPGGTVLLRIVNSASMTAFHVDLDRLEGTLVAVDGAAVAPVAGRRFPIAVAQRLDILVTLPGGPGAYPVLATVEGERKRTGIVLVAGNAPVARIAEKAEAASPALTLDLESGLRARQPLAPRPADRVHRLDLTGQMAGYVWSINNVVWNREVPPLQIAEGERVEIILDNKTPMPHPMHLHGHQFQVVEIDGARFSGARRDTVLVPPGRRVVVAFDADNPGHWAFHCHLLYHMHTGMFATFRYV